MVPMTGRPKYFSTSSGVLMDVSRNSRIKAASTPSMAPSTSDMAMFIAFLGFTGLS